MKRPGKKTRQVPSRTEVKALGRGPSTIVDYSKASPIGAEAAPIAAISIAKLGKLK